jgi:hypothetical protein
MILMEPGPELTLLLAALESVRLPDAPDDEVAG